MAQNPPEAVRRYINAYNAKDVEAMLACLSSDIRFTNITAGEVTAASSGLPQFRDLADAALTLFSQRHQEITQAITVGTTTLAEINYAATVAQDLPNGWKTGERVWLKGASLFDLKDGKIARLIDQS